MKGGEIGKVSGKKERDFGEKQRGRTGGGGDVSTVHL